MSEKINTNILKKKYLNFLFSQEIKSEPFYNKLGQLKNFYLPICEKIYQDFMKTKQIKIIGLTGGQGAGKSTITQIIKLILNYKYNLKVVFFSIDDFYKTLKERTQLSENSHTLFKVRGVPGTHDTKLLKKAFQDLTKKKFHLVLVSLGAPSVPGENGLAQVLLLSGLVGILVVVVSVFIVGGFGDAVIGLIRVESNRGDIGFIGFFGGETGPA